MYIDCTLDDINSKIGKPFSSLALGLSCVLSFGIGFVLYRMCQ